MTNNTADSRPVAEYMLQRTAKSPRLADPLIRALLAGLSSRKSSRRLTILIFHRVLTSPDPLFPGEVCLKRFSEIVSWMTSWFRVLPLEEAARHLRNDELPARAACITFDDGYADNVTNALPVLRQHGAPATFFIATGYLNGGRMWNDTIIEAVRRTRLSALDLGELDDAVYPTSTMDEKRETILRLLPKYKYDSVEPRERHARTIAECCEVELPSDLMMSDDGVRTLARSGMTIGAHTVDHPILRLCDDDEAERQIQQSKDYLESVTGQPIRLFAYPNGKPDSDYKPDQARLVERLGFLAAVSTAHGASTSADDPYQLRRFTPWDRTPYRFAARLALNFGK